MRLFGLESLRERVRHLRGLSASGEESRRTQRGATVELMGSGRIDAKEMVKELARPRGPEEPPVYTLRKKTITGRLDLKHRTIEVAVDIQNCKFEGEVDFTYCEFKQAVRFSDCVFRERFNSGDAAESHSVYRKDLNCTGTVFGGPFELNGGVIAGTAYFSGAKFLNQGKAIDFAGTSIGESAEFDETHFEGVASFNTLRCKGTLHMRKATFKREVDFAHASVDGGLDCQGTVFKQEATFNTLRCGGAAFFNPATFEKRVDFVHASVDGTLDCREAVFKQEAIFDSLRCRGAVFFNLATFKGQTNFAIVGIDGNLICLNASFDKRVDFESIRVSQRLQISGADFGGYVNLNQGKMGILQVGNSLPFGEDSQLDLRGCRFDAFNGTPEVAEALAKKQRPEEFSRDPYLQLEKYYRGAGNDLQAKRFHYLGSRELRENAKDPDGITRWGTFTRWGDWWIKWLTGYGVQTWRLLVPICFFLVLGTFPVFWGADALLPALSGQQAQGQVGLVGHLFERAAYSLDLFLPVVNLHVDENWRPNGLLREIYAVVHSLVGWVLVPLLLASLAGIVRRE